MFSYCIQKWVGTKYFFYCLSLSYLLR